MNIWNAQKTTVIRFTPEMDIHHYGGYLIERHTMRYSIQRKWYKLWRAEIVKTPSIEFYIVDADLGNYELQVTPVSDYLDMCFFSGFEAYLDGGMCDLPYTYAYNLQTAIEEEYHKFEYSESNPV